MKDEQFTQILRAINDVRGDLKEFKDEMNRRWDENNKRWQTNSTEHAIIHGKIDKLNETVERRFYDTLKVFESYEETTESMYQENKQKIEILQRQLKIANA